MSNTIGTLFINATRNKSRIETNQGLLSIEDLWDLSLIVLDKLAVSINETLDTTVKKSFLTNPDRKVVERQQEDRDILEIIKHIIDVKQTENSAKLERSKKLKQLEFLEGLKKKRSLEKMEGLSEAEIDEQIKALES